MDVWGGVGKIVKYGGMTQRYDRSSNKRLDNTLLRQASSKHIGSQLLHGLPVMLIDALNAVDLKFMKDTFTVPNLEKQKTHTGSLTSCSMGASSATTRKGGTDLGYIPFYNSKLYKVTE